MTRVLVSAAEASADRLIAEVIRASDGQLEAFGLGGESTELAGAELVANLRPVNAMGLWAVPLKASRLLHAYRSLIAAARDQQIRVALLAGSTELNARLGKKLRAMGIRVVWCAAPQVWAWRRGRLRTLHDSVDQLALLFPFEQQLWSDHGYQAEFVGHPALDCTQIVDRTNPSNRDATLAVLCGSRDHEALGAGVDLLGAAKLWTTEHPNWRAQVIVAQSLSARCQQTITRIAEQLGFSTVLSDRHLGAAPFLFRFDMALAVSGTASLEAALSGCVPVVGYRFDPLTALAARALVRVQHIAMPNILLGERVFPELVQGDLYPEAVVRAANDALENWDHLVDQCRRVRALMDVGDGLTFGKRAARMVLAEALPG